MHGGDNLKTAIWDDFQRESAALFSPRKGTALPHGIGMLKIALFLQRPDLAIHYVNRRNRIALDQYGLILLGNPHEFCPDARRLLKSAGYPSRYEVNRAGGGFAMLDRHGNSAIPIPSAPDRHLGLVYRGRASDLTGRPTLLLAGASPYGVLGAVLWAMQSALADIPAPDHFPHSPIESLVQVRPAGHLVPVRSDVETVTMACGPRDYDSQGRAWKDRIRPAAIEVILMRGEPVTIVLGGKEIPVTTADLPRMLLFLIAQSLKGEWTTVRHLQAVLDGEPNARRMRTVMTRWSEILRLLGDRTLLEIMEKPNMEPAYRLRAEVIFTETTAPPP